MKKNVPVTESPQREGAEKDKRASTVEKLIQVERVEESNRRFSARCVRYLEDRDKIPFN